MTCQKELEGELLSVVERIVKHGKDYDSGWVFIEAVRVVEPLLAAHGKIAVCRYTIEDAVRAIRLLDDPSDEYYELSRPSSAQVATRLEWGTGRQGVASAGGS